MSRLPDRCLQGSVFCPPLSGGRQRPVQRAQQQRPAWRCEPDLVPRSSTGRPEKKCCCRRDGLGAPLPAEVRAPLPCFVGEQDGNVCEIAGAGSASYLSVTRVPAQLQVPGLGRPACRLGRHVLNPRPCPQQQLCQHDSMAQHSWHAATWMSSWRRSHIQRRGMGRGSCWCACGWARQRL